ncbi:5'-nucleotidase [Siniperca chuatsi]|uniref:5'-nucleotidase n=1 Tax=Siniperca chuatsi TaxID=119488 RepID=UPI001CE16172|nr:5'-nucleotidase [Siniperca chuatsi]XP_044026073.1 5'-nucleotidase [Siniperca chuatsi]XP_044026075.1 5'-nucleotidase [Siniperca chuatsi]XP_044026076.1 5'-nucleotidase [Siniperca chuatsi]XP_044026077.1 5'-nucleotidase [Siniperca chuatsi]
MGAVRPERCALPRLCLHLCLLLLQGSSVSTSASWDLVLLHTNDVHARVEQTSKHSGKCGSSGGCFAGVARRATMIKKIRSSESNVLLLDAGDQFQGTVWFNYYKGAEAAHFMNKLRYDAMVFGNHEFDNGVEGLMKPFMEEIKCPVLSANIKTDETLARTFGNSYLPFKIFTVGSERVGVVGYTSQETPALSRPGPHLRFEDEVNALQLQVNKLQTLGVNKIIALGHSGFTVDQKIAKKVRGVDVVIGGHSNTFLFTGPPPSSEFPAGPYPFMVESDDGRQVPVVQAYAFGKYLGYLKVTFDDAGNVVQSTGNPILLDSSVQEDPEVLADVEEWKKNLANYSAQVVGKTLVFLNGTAEECRFRECNLGNLICDAMIDNNIRFSDDAQWNHVSACMLNGGGVRASVDERTRNGSITMEDLISVLPFGGTFDLVQLKGSTLRKAFEHSVRRYGQSSGEFLQVSGFHAEFDLAKPPGQRVKSLRILCTKCQVPHYEPVEDDTVYKVALPSYMVTGGDGFSMIRNETLKHDSGDLDISVVSSYITQRKIVYPSVEERIKIYNAASGLRGQTAPLVLLVSLGLLWTLCGSM